jgi:cell shape-determining protein MreC
LAEQAMLHDRMKALGELRQNTGSQASSTPACVVLNGETSGRRDVLVLDRGSSGGIHPYRPVVWGDHYVGITSEVGPWTARVRRFTDPGFRIRVAVVPPTHREGGASGPLEGASGPLEGASGPLGGTSVKCLDGILEGLGGDRARLKWVLPPEESILDWLVVTAGSQADGTPQGLTLGRVGKPLAGGEPFALFEVEPDLQMDRLREIHVLGGGTGG